MEWLWNSKTTIELTSWFHTFRLSALRKNGWFESHENLGIHQMSSPRNQQYNLALVQCGTWILKGKPKLMGEKLRHSKCIRLPIVGFQFSATPKSTDWALPCPAPILWCPLPIRFGHVLSGRKHGQPQNITTRLPPKETSGLFRPRSFHANCFKIEPESFNDTNVDAKMPIATKQQYRTINSVSK